jgi:hypothetical protein
VKRVLSDITGKRFNKLLVLRRDKVLSRRDSGNTNSIELWICRCACGNTRSVRRSRLTGKKLCSFPCCKRESHGLSKLPEYGVWIQMRERCNRPRNPAFHMYGGRGIRVCAQWRSFQTFLDDMGRRPSSKHSIDRIDNDGPYSPENCRWATQREQMRNMRTNVFVTHDGRRQCIIDWAREFDVDSKSLRVRLKRGEKFTEAIAAIRRRQRAA